MERFLERIEVGLGCSTLLTLDLGGIRKGGYCFFSLFYKQFLKYR